MVPFQFHRARSQRKQRDEHGLRQAPRGWKVCLPCSSDATISDAHTLSSGIRGLFFNRSNGTVFEPLKCRIAAAILQTQTQPRLRQPCQPTATLPPCRSVRTSSAWLPSHAPRSSDHTQPSARAKNVRTARLSLACGIVMRDVSSQELSVSH